MPRRYVVRQGDCISSIAFRHGFFPDRVWDHPDNASLVELRRDPSVLFPGDVVVVPDLRPKSCELVTGKHHHFLRRGVPEVLQLRFIDPQDRPRAGVPYTLILEGVPREGQTDGEGLLRETIAPDAAEAEIVFEGGERYVMQLGSVDPIDTISGAQKRLGNLGYGCEDDPPGELGPATQVALGDFQRDHGLAETGTLDDVTLAKLQAVHRS